jgi:MraZ protein
VENGGVIEQRSGAIVMDANSSVLASAVSGLGLLVGDYTHQLDPKRRLTIPSVWRAQMGEPKSLFAMPDLHDKCLNIFPAAVMLQKLEKLRASSITDKRAMDFTAWLGENSDLMSWDSQGRIRVRDKLLAYAGLNGQVRMLGSVNRIQLWAPENRPEVAVIDPAEIMDSCADFDF